jgi:hypothetical protein
MADAKEDVKGAVKDVLDSRREFTLETPDGEILHFYIASPSGEDIRKADWQYSKIFNQAIVDGFLTQSQMLQLLKEKGILNEDYTDVLENTRISLGAELFKLENLMEESTESDREMSAMEVARLRDELFQLNQRINGPMANTCENLSEDARTDYLTSRIIQNKDKTRRWEDFDAYKNEENTALAIKSRFEVMLWMQGLDSNFLENTPEQTALRGIAQERLERAVAEEQERSQKEADEVDPPKEEVEATVEELELPDEPKAKAPEKSKGRPKGSKNKPKTPKDE